MAYPGTTDWPTSVDAAVARVDLVDIVYDEDFNYPDSQILAIQVFLGTTGTLIGVGAAGQGPGGMVSPVADGASAIAFKLVARDSFVTNGGKLLSVGDDYDSSPPAYTQKFGVGAEGVVELNPIATLPTDYTKGRFGYKSGTGEGLYVDDGVAWNIVGGGGGGGNDALPGIDNWVVVDKTTSSYTEDGTIQFPEDTIAAGIIAAVAMSPTVAHRVGIKIMPGHYTESALDLPEYVYVIGESKEACVITQTADVEIVTQTNDNAGYYNVTIDREGSAGLTDTGTFTLTADSPGFGSVTLDAVGASFLVGMIGQSITISGCTNPANNGTFTITAVNSLTQLVYTHPGFGYGSVTEPFTWALAPTTWAVDIDEALNIVFRDVDFSFDARLGIHVRGTSPSSVRLARCKLDQAFFLLSGAAAVAVQVTGVGDHALTLDDVDGEQCAVSSAVGSLRLVDTHLQQLGVSGTANLYVFQSRVTTKDFFDDEPSMSTVFAGVVTLGTTGQVWLERSTFLGVSWDDGCSVLMARPLLINTQPDDLICSSCRFGEGQLGYSPPTGIYLALDFSVYSGTLKTGTFRNCTFDVGVSPSIHDPSDTPKLAGVGQMYNTAAEAVQSAALVSQDDIVIKLMSDDSSSPGTSWPDGYHTILDLNGFTISGSTLCAAEVSGDNPQVTVKNGRVAGSMLFRAWAPSTANWKVTYRNIDVDPVLGAGVFFLGGGTSAELIFDDVRGWVGSAGEPVPIRLIHANPTVSIANCRLIGRTTFAINFQVASTKFRATRSTFVHASGGANNPFTSAAGTVATLDFCRFNADPTLSANITATAESAYNIFDNALQDFGW